MSSFISNSYSFRVRVQAIWGENSSKCSRHRGFLMTLSSPSNVHQCSNNSRKNSFARFMPFHFRYWKSYPQKIWNLTTNASSHFISRVPGTRHGFDIVPCFILSYAWWYIFPQPTIRILFHWSPDDKLDIFLIFLTMCLMIYLLIFSYEIFLPTPLLCSRAFFSQNSCTGSVTFFTKMFT